VPAPDPYSGNYGYRRVGSDPGISDGERQWYIANGLGDPLEQIERREATGEFYPAYPLTDGKRNIAPYDPRIFEMRKYYRGVTPEARVLYNTAADRAKAVSDASAQYARERANSTSVRTGDQGVRYNYAGTALGIPG
jgi:hypothetical protein